MEKEVKNSLQLDATEKHEALSRRTFLAGTGGASAALALAATGLLSNRAFSQTSTTPSTERVTDERPFPAGKEISVDKGVWVVKESVALRALTIAEGATLAAPEGKSLTMTIEGVGTAMKPGIYKGDILLSVADN